MLGLNKIKDNKQNLVACADKIKILGKITVRDIDSETIYTSDIVEIVNNYTQFSKNKRKISCRSPIVREEIRRGYDTDRFGEVVYIERKVHRGHWIDKTNFITDSGCITWRIPHNLRKYDIKGGCGAAIGVEKSKQFHNTTSI